MEIRKKVYSFDLGRVIDRTTQSHPLGNFDIDFRKKNASNPLARGWTYGGSAKTIKKAKKDAQKIQNEVGAETRIVNALTGEVLI